MTRLLQLLAICFMTAMAFTPAASAPESPAATVERQILVMVRHPPDHYRANGGYGGGYGDDLSRSARERLARSIAKRYGLTLVENWPMPMIGVDCFVMNVPDARSTTAAAEQLAHDRDVEWAEPMQLYSGRGGAASHNDPLYAAEPAAAEWHLADLHRLATGRGTTVAVVDSGIDARHPDLAGQVQTNVNFVAGRPLVAEEHGTAVAGIIAGKADNGVGIAGVAPGTSLLGLRACWQVAGGRTVCDTLSLAKALYFAAEKRPNVINLSLSGPDTRLLRALLAAAMDRGSAVVAAFDRSRPDGGFPASVPRVIAASDGLAPAGGKVYTAPGKDVPTTEPGGRWFLVNGSSFAAAHVSGLLALMRERQHSAALTLIAKPRGGAIDACATLARVSSACDCSCGPYRFASARTRR
jgi:subtilisin family serine protease